MLRLENIEKKKFDDFVKNHKLKSHFLQSVAWGEFAKVKKNVTPHYLGLVTEDNQIVGTALLLEKKLPMNYCYFYCPRGFVIDYNNHKVVKTMTEKIKEYAKEKKAIFVKIDPDIIKNEWNYLNEEVKLENNAEKIFQFLKSCGWKHQGFTKNFETAQPRYTFRIDLTQDLETIEDHFSKTTKQRIAKAIKLETEVEIGTKKDLKEFSHLMTLTENRKDFVSYNEDYYNTLYEIFNGNDSTKATLFLGKVHINKTKIGRAHV